MSRGPSATWDPSRYLRFADARTRPAADLLRVVGVEAPDEVVDLGCGAGNVTRLLRRRWPAARIVGLDASATMLERARRDHHDLDVRWVEADLRDHVPARPVDVVFSNAVLHWLDDHDELVPRLLGWLRPGGVLAVQVPANHDQPSHVLARRIAVEGPWADRLRPLLRPHPVEDPATYVDLLVPGSSTVDVWETVYWHRLSGDDPVAAWTAGSMLRPVLAALEPPEAELFVERYRIALRRAYPRRADGTTLFPFRRLFITATRS